MQIELIIAGLFGIALQVLVKMNSINNRLANETFKSVFDMYFKSERFSLIISLVVVLGTAFISNEWLENSVSSKEDAANSLGSLMFQNMLNYIKTVFIFVGYTANSIVGAFLGKTEKRLIERSKE